MTERKDKDVWEKISDAAATAGKAIGDEYTKVKLSHELWNRKHDLKAMYARVGEIAYKRHTESGETADDELNVIFTDIAKLEDTIAQLIQKKEDIDAKSPEPSTEPISTDDKTTDDGNGSTSNACSECGEAISFDDGQSANFCGTCGNRLM